MAKKGATHSEAMQIQATPMEPPKADTSIKRGKTDSMMQTPLPTASGPANASGNNQPAAPMMDQGPPNSLGPAGVGGQPGAPTFESRDSGKASNKLG